MRTPDGRTPELQRDPEKLTLCVCVGRVATRGGGSLSFEYRYTLELIVLGYRGHADAILVPRGASRRHRIDAMADDLTALEDWVAPLLAKLTKKERLAPARQVGQALRHSQAVQIAAQQAPDRSAYAPRKAEPKLRQKPERIRLAMAVKLRTAKTPEGGVG